MKAPTLLAVARHRGTEISNPFPSSGESANCRSPTFLKTSKLGTRRWGSERLTGALLDRLTHHVHILELNGDSYRLKQSKRRQRQPQAAELSDN